MERHQLLRTTLRAAHGLSDPHGVPFPSRSRASFRDTQRRHIVGIELLQEVRVFLRHQATVHTILHQIVDVPAYLLPVLLKLRVLLQRTARPFPAHLGGHVRAEHRLVLDRVRAVHRPQQPQQPQPLPGQLCNIRVKILRHPPELPLRVRPHLRVLHIEVTQGRSGIQHRLLLVLRQAHTVDVVQIEHINLECVVVVLALLPDGREDTVQALSHLLGVHVRLCVRDHADTGRRRGAGLIVELIEIRVVDRL